MVPIEISWETAEEKTKSSDLSWEMLSYRIASKLTDPVCLFHESCRKFQVADDLFPNVSKIELLARKALIAFSALFYGALSTVLTVPGILFREAAIFIQKKPFLSEVSESKKKLGNDRKFTIYSWNICCVGGGYTLTDGGVVPWRERIDKIVKNIIEVDADVNCIYETLDTESAFYLREKLREKGYSHIYFNMGAKSVGTSSGILIASKFSVDNPHFEAFPQEMLVGRTKHAAKGFFSFDLVSQSKAFATVIATHLQHSEEPEFPTQEEVAARRLEMGEILKKVDKIKDRALILTGDLNLDEKEYEASSWKNIFEKGEDYQGKKTWGGDSFCAALVQKRASKALNLDHTLALKGSVASIRTTLVDAGYNAEKLSLNALSDHNGLYTEVIVHEKL